jgi:hypothetical protein
MARQWGLAGKGALATANGETHMGINKTRADRLADDQAMIAGIQKIFAQNATLTFGSQTMTPAALVAIFQGRITVGQAVVQAETARTTAVKADRDERASTAKTVNAFRRFVLATFTESPDTLATFNLTVPKTASTTVAVKAQAQAKSKATRAARKPATSAPEPTTGNASTPAPVTAAPAAKPTA